jgi:hypothetical protein
MRKQSLLIYVRRNLLAFNFKGTWLDQGLRLLLDELLLDFVDAVVRFALLVLFPE